MTSQSSLTTTFASAIEGMAQHTRLEGLYDALAHISDATTALGFKPRVSEDNAGYMALAALDDFVMDQMDAVKEKALATEAIDWPNKEARIAILLKHVARYRADVDEMVSILDKFGAEIAAD